MLSIISITHKMNRYPHSRQSVAKDQTNEGDNDETKASSSDSLFPGEQQDFRREEESSADCASADSSNLGSLLHQNYTPSPYTVVAGRGKKPRENLGNKHLRVLASTYLSEYSEAKSKRTKTRIVDAIYATIQAACPNGGSFVKYSKKTGRWYEVDELVAREKIGYVFRDLLSDKYKSSSKSKVAARKQPGEDDPSGMMEEDQLKQMEQLHQMQQLQLQQMQQLQQIQQEQQRQHQQQMQLATGNMPSPQLPTMTILDRAVMPGADTASSNAAATAMMEGSQAQQILHAIRAQNTAASAAAGFPMAHQFQSPQQQQLQLQQQQHPGMVGSQNFASAGRLGIHQPGGFHQQVPMGLYQGAMMGNIHGGGTGSAYATANATSTIGDSSMDERKPSAVASSTDVSPVGRSSLGRQNNNQELGDNESIEDHDLMDNPLFD